MKNDRICADRCAIRPGNLQLAVYGGCKMKYSREVITLAKQMARGIVKQSIKDAGLEVSTVSAKQVAIAVKGLLNATPDIYKDAKREIAKRERVMKRKRKSK